MKCPHCLTEFHDNPQNIDIGHDQDGYWLLVQQTCPACNRFVLHLQCGDSRIRLGDIVGLRNVEKNILVRPKGINRSPCPPEIPDGFATDYREACLVVADSAKASAALSRRCMQHILREKAGIRHSDLATEIQECLDKRVFPTYIADSLDAVRNIGNFASHPIKTKSTGEIVDVEPGEAEWNLDVLEALFDFFFVGPAKVKAKKEALNKKLDDAGKPPMKG